MVRSQTSARPLHNSEDTTALRDAEKWELTGVARFEAFGLQFLLAGEPAFWYGPETALSPAQIVCHSLVSDTDSRRTSYALLLIEHVQLDAETLLDTAKWYELETTVSDMYCFLEREAEPTTETKTALPGGSEYEALKSQYGVA